MIGHAGDRDHRRADQAADQDGEADQHHVGDGLRPVGVAGRLHEAVDVGLGAGDAQDVAAVELGLRQHGDVHRRRAAADRREEDAAGVGLLRGLDQGAVVQLLAGEEHVDRLDRDVEELGVVDLDAFAEHADEDLAATGDRHDVAGLQHRLGGEGHHLAAAAHAFDEQALVAAEPFGGRDGQAGDLALVADGVGAQLAGAAGADEGGLRRAARHLALVAGALGGDVDAEQLRAEEGEDPAGADGAEEVGDGVGDRDQVELGLGLLGREAGLVDRVGGEADRRRDGLRAGHEARRRGRGRSRRRWRRCRPRRGRAPRPRRRRSPAARRRWRCRGRTAGRRRSRRRRGT